VVPGDGSGVRQWFGRSIPALNTDTAPDLLYNNYERVIRVSDQTNKLMDLRPVLAQVADKSFLTEDDLRLATHGPKMIILPIQRVQMGFGVRKSCARQGWREVPRHLG